MPTEIAKACDPANDGKQINPNEQVRVTGKLSVTTDGKTCFITAAKIEN